MNQQPDWRYMMYQNPKISNDYHKLFEESKKKDDLSDSYLQGLYFIDLNN